MTPGEVVPLRQSHAEVAVPTWTRQQADLIRRVVAPGCNDDELAFFAQVCQHRGLDPFARQIVCIMRWNEREKRKIPVIQETVAGLRAIADRTGLYAGQDAPEWCGPDGVWKDVWLSKEPPAAARVRVYRKDFLVPTTGVARYASYVQLGRDGKPTALWASGVDFMLAKCAEAAALRKAFPEHIGGRDMPPQSRIAMEAKSVGLDDDARHALVSQVTGGRTQSTRDLTDHEVLEVRAAIAQAAAEAEEPDEEGPSANVDRTTGEVNRNEATRSVSDIERRRLITDLKARAQELSDDDWARFCRFLRESGIGMNPDDYTADEAYTVSAWFTDKRNQAPEATQSGPPAPQHARRPEGAPSEGVGNPAQAATPSPSWEHQTPREEAGPAVIPGQADRSRPSWEQAIAEATAGFEMDDVLAIAEAATGRQYLTLDDVAVDQQEAVLDAIRRVSAGDAELDYSQGDLKPRLMEVPF